MTTFLAAIVLFGVLITIHELGHFLAAKGTGMLVTEFSVGFGPKLLQKKLGETIYTLRLIPMGGYNRIAGMDPGDFSVERGFNNKPLWARMFVILAGPLMNILLPLVIFFGVFAFHGIDVPLDKPIIGTVMHDYHAESAGILPGDRILSINNTATVSWGDISRLVEENAPVPSYVILQRNGEKKRLIVKPEYQSHSKRYLIGVTPIIEHKALGVGESFIKAFSSVKRVAVAMVQSLKLILTKEVSAELSGPLGVAHMAGSVAAQGAVPYLNFMAFLSINLAILNLLPIPALDGGQFLVLIIEGILGHALPVKAKEVIQALGVICIILITVAATFHDLMR